MTTQRERLLGAARADLVALPALVEELAKLVADRHHDVTGYKGKVVGSPAPLQIPTVHLTDTRRKPGWHGADPEYANVFKRYGIAPGLEAWVRKLAEALPEWPELTEHPSVRSEAAVLIEFWSFVCDQTWAETLANQIRAVTGQVKAGLGVPKEQRYLCPECQNPAYVVPGGILSCVEGHERIVRNLEQEQRRRPMATTKEILDEFGEQYGVTAVMLRQWKVRRRITVAREDRGKNWWWPWDVFCLLNPDIAEAIRLRDEVTDETPETA